MESYYEATRAARLRDINLRTALAGVPDSCVVEIAAYAAVIIALYRGGELQRVDSGPMGEPETTFAQLLQSLRRGPERVGQVKQRFARWELLAGLYKRQRSLRDASTFGEIDLRPPPSFPHLFNPKLHSQIMARCAMRRHI